jgi:hypothetical protein
VPFLNFIAVALTTLFVGYHVFLFVQKKWKVNELLKPLQMNTYSDNIKYFNSNVDLNSSINIEQHAVLQKILTALLIQWGETIKPYFEEYPEAPTVELLKDRLKEHFSTIKASELVQQRILTSLGNAEAIHLAIQNIIASTDSSKVISAIEYLMADISATVYLTENIRYLYFLKVEFRLNSNNFPLSKINDLELIYKLKLCPLYKSFIKGLILPQPYYGQLFVWNKVLDIIRKD